MTNAHVGQDGGQPGRALAGKLVRALRRFFWIEERVARARERSFAPGSPGFTEFRLGEHLLADADLLGEPAAEQPSSLLLYRAAASLLVRARLVRTSMTDAADGTDGEWARLVVDPSATFILAQLSPEERSLVDSALHERGENHLAKLPRAERGRAGHALRKTARALAAPMIADTRPLRNALLLRAAKLGLGVIAVVLVGSGVGWEYERLTARPNLALGRGVTVSSQDPNYGTDPRALVDGDRTNLGFHTASGANQQVTIDLGTPQSISRVVVYNRADCCEQRAVPLELAVSLDGLAYQFVEGRTQPFTRWAVDLPKTPARYVRLTDRRDDYFHLSEVEVY